MASRERWIGRFTITLEKDGGNIFLRLHRVRAIFLFHKLVQYINLQSLRCLLLKKMYKLDYSMTHTFTQNSM